MLLRFFATAALAVTTAAIASACAGGSQPPDPCERAFQRLVDECDYTISGLDTVDLHCSGQSVCIAACLENSPCADVIHANGEFADCTAACQ